MAVRLSLMNSTLLRQLRFDLQGREVREEWLPERQIHGYLPTSGATSKPAWKVGLVEKHDKASDSYCNSSTEARKRGSACMTDAEPKDILAVEHV